ncbi:MAG: PEP-CTERM sorting domain-containing protein [Methylomonas sp.]|jgi:hypothetical protein
MSKNNYKACAFAASIFFAASSAPIQAVASIAEYEITGADGKGDSFNALLGFNTTTDMFSELISASYTDSTGTYKLNQINLSSHLADGSDYTQLINAQGEVLILHTTPTNPPAGMTEGGLQVETATPQNIPLILNPVTVAYSAIEITPFQAAVPEPSSLALLTTGLLGIGAFRKKTAQT